MPKKIRELVRSLIGAGWQLEKGGKGSHRKFGHARIARKLVLSGQDGADANVTRKRTSRQRSTKRRMQMKEGDAYLKWVEWSEEDALYIGRCPDLFMGGCHGNDPVHVYAELCEIVAETVASFEREGKPLPVVKTRPLVAA